MKNVVSIILALVLAVNTLPLPAMAAVNTETPAFQRYLQEIGMTRKEFETYLRDYHDMSLKGNDFANLQDLKDYLGEILTEKNLNELLDDFDLTKEELEQLLKENDMDLSDFHFYDDLYFEVSWLQSDSGLTAEDLEAIKQEMLSELAQFGITKEEADRLFNHLEKVIENTGEEAFFDRALDLAFRMIEFADFDGASDLTAGQVAELLSIWNDMLDLFQVKVEYYLVKNGVETPVSFSALAKMTTTNGADLLLKIYTRDGEFLADVLFTKEMFGSELLHETGAKTKTLSETVKAKATAKSPVAKTINGGELPNTASDYMANTLIGLVFIGIGTLLFRRFKTKGA